MTVYRYCKICSELHSLDDPWPKACMGHYGIKHSESPQIIKDIEPYRAVGSDVANGGRPPVIHSRSEHRDFLKRNNYVEVGNEILPPKHSQESDLTGREIKHAFDKVRSGR